MLKKLLYLLLVLYISNINFCNAYAEEILDISAKSAILMDLTTGEILYAKNENTSMYPASITKILTTLIALEYNKPNEIITFSKDAIFGIDRSSSHLAMDVSEQITIEDALYGIMLMSANEVSAGIAEHISGSIEDFSILMNERAIKAGALNSNFKNPHGLHDKEHYTTGLDMAIISREAYKLPKFREIISTLTYQIPPTNKQKEIRYLANQHQMFKNTIYKYEGCTGGKTGFTNEAQSTLVTFAERDGLQLVCVVLGESGNIKYTDTKKLFDYGFSNFKLETLYAFEYPNSLPVYNDDNNILGYTDVYVEEKNINTIIPKNIDNSQIVQVANIPNQLTSPIDSDTIIGTLDFYYNEKLIYTTNLKNKKNFKYLPVVKVIKKKTINNTFEIKENKYKEDFKFIIALILIPLVLMFFIFLCIKSYKKKQRRKRWYATRRF